MLKICFYTEQNGKKEYELNSNEYSFKLFGSNGEGNETLGIEITYDLNLNNENYLLSKKKIYDIYKDMRKETILKTQLFNDDIIVFDSDLLGVSTFGLNLTDMMGFVDPNWNLDVNVESVVSLTIAFHFIEGE